MRAAPQGRRRSRLSILLIALGVALLALDTLTLFGSVRATTAPSARGVEVALTRGGIFLRTGDIRIFGRPAGVRWENLPGGVAKWRSWGWSRRLWWFSSGRFSVSGRGWRERHIPLWTAWFSLLAVGVLMDPLHRMRRARQGLCVECAYPRAGLAPDALCPECGTPATLKRHGVARETEEVCSA